MPDTNHLIEWNWNSQFSSLIQSFLPALTLFFNKVSQEHVLFFLKDNNFVILNMISAFIYNIVGYRASYYEIKTWV